MFIDTTLSLRSQFLVCKWKILQECHTKWGVGAFLPCTSFPISLQKAECLLLQLSGALCVFISLFDSVCLFLSTLNCTRQDILFWKSGTRCALINWVYCFYGINRILLLHWDIVRACILYDEKNRPKLDHSIMYSWKTLFPFLTYSMTWNFA